MSFPEFEKPFKRRKIQNVKRADIGVVERKSDKARGKGGPNEHLGGEPFLFRVLRRLPQEESDGESADQNLPVEIDAIPRAVSAFPDRPQNDQRTEDTGYADREERCQTFGFVQLFQRGPGAKPRKRGQRAEEYTNGGVVGDEIIAVDRQALECKCYSNT